MSIFHILRLNTKYIYLEMQNHNGFHDCTIDNISYIHFSLLLFTEKKMTFMCLNFRKCFKEIHKS